ncbi:Cupin 2 barrel domain-containing protein [Streptomyces albus]|uniref:Cupin 2 barrel domain-containing protein n=1 Tax=Streptomyces albus (strain ATCC 21838 / DSM 41398 / FERM P-419 / JCM 4703 / NBRC 107858) TaxID=1081613 RepID=A0A0B5EUJ4_STRA4|nr:Cupin 2 barrel domain-containing protein [Streptomyces albus]AOU76657.1 Cupin 2 barrel domain-containing protein [Streptomyces albus]AYN32438.1 cupin [Streptomyces albus]
MSKDPIKKPSKEPSKEPVKDPIKEPGEESLSGARRGAERQGGEPIALAEALASFDALWSPRVVTRVNDYDVRLAKVEGEHLWHVHEDTDEFFLVLGGELRIGLREPAGERTVRLPRGSVFTVPRGTEHKPAAPSGATLLLFEPTGTSSVGDRHEEVPDHVDATTGHPLAP